MTVFIIYSVIALNALLVCGYCSTLSQTVKRIFIESWTYLGDQGMILIILRCGAVQVF